MASIRVSQSDAPRVADPATNSTARARDVSVSQEVQQRFERLMQAKPRSLPKDSSDRSEYTGEPLAGEDLSLSEATMDMLKKIHSRGERLDSDVDSDELAQANDQDQCELGLPDQTTCEYEDAFGSNEMRDSLIEELLSKVHDEMPSAVESLVVTSPLPSAVDIIRGVAETPAVPSSTTERIHAPVETRLVDLARQVVERIMVSDAAVGPQAVHIQVKETILPGTEIRLSEQAGQLQVNLVTDQHSSLEFLTQQQGSLCVQLEQSLARNVIVHVNFDSLPEFSSGQQSQSQAHSESFESPDDSADRNEAEDDR